MKTAKEQAREDMAMKELLITALKAESTGRWRWDRIHCCLTGKDADLESHGEQGIEIVDVSDGQVICKAHILKTVAGEDVCLNFTPDEEEDEELVDKAKEEYLRQADNVITGTMVKGEWDGDSWMLFDNALFIVKLRDICDRELTVKDLVRAIIEAGELALVPLSSEIARMDDTLDMLAGWKDIDDKHHYFQCPPGHPGKYATWRLEE